MVKGYSNGAFSSVPVALPIMATLCLIVTDWLPEGDKVSVYNRAGAPSSGGKIECAMVTTGLSFAINFFVEWTPAMLMGDSS